MLRLIHIPLWYISSVVFERNWGVKRWKLLKQRSPDGLNKVPKLFLGQNLGEFFLQTGYSVHDTKFWSINLRWSI